MQKEFRKKFNKEFSEERYSRFIHELNTSTYYPVDFRVSETPIFLTGEFTDELVKAAYEIAEQLQSKEFKKKSINAVPENLFVPNETDRPVFLQIDFAVCKDENDKFIPKLIELQGFPSLYCFQYFLNQVTKKHFNIPSDLTPYFSGLNDESYINLLKETITGNADPENVILLEIEPEKQKTRIDFACTEELLGIKTVCLTKIKKNGNRLFYDNDGKETLINRIYNRVIFDELQRKNLSLNFNFTDELDVTWVGHPNWFFKLSKHSLPSLTGKYVPQCYFLEEIAEYPDDLENYVLKPLFSFAGSGVEVDVTKEMLDIIKYNSIMPAGREGYILQKKVEYAPFIKTPDIPAKAEIRMMFLWSDSGSLSVGANDKPMLVNNLVRMSKGKMMGVAFNKDKTWVGSSVAYHP